MSVLSSISFVPFFYVLFNIFEVGKFGKLKTLVYPYNKKINSFKITMYIVEFSIIVLRYKNE